MTGEKLSSVGHTSPREGDSGPGELDGGRRDKFSSAFPRPEAGAALGMTKMRMRLAEQSGGESWSLPWERLESH